jgi:hypothetical protein
MEFAVYGLSIQTPEDWRVELNPKSERIKGDVAFHTPDGSRFYISWGPLKDIVGKFNRLEEHRDFSINQVKRGRDVDSLTVSEMVEGQIMGHRSLSVRLVIRVRSGLMGRTASARIVCSTHFHCPNFSRYYVFYALSNAKGIQEPEFWNLYKRVSESIKCHQSATSD